MASPRKSIILALASLAGVVLVGTLGYLIVEGWGLLDSLYMAVITLSTVGFGEVGKLSPAGKLFTILVILMGITVAAFVARVLTQTLFEAQLSKFFGRKKLEKEIASLRNHYVICGYGRMGRLICQELAASGVPLVVIEQEPGAIEELTENGFLYIKGDATEEECLCKAGIERARGLVAVVSSDANNLFITLTARQLNGKLHILARAEEEASEKKLVRAGANRVVSPYIIGAQHLAQAILRPAVVDFIELATQSQSMELFMEELPVAAESPLANKSLKDSGLRQELGLMVVAIMKSSGQMLFNPGADVILEPGDQLVTLGEKKALAGLEKAVLPKERRG